MHGYVRFCHESRTFLHSIVAMFCAYAIVRNVIIMVRKYYYLSYDIIEVDIATSQSTRTI